MRQRVRLGLVRTMWVVFAVRVGHASGDGMPPVVVAEEEEGPAAVHVQDSPNNTTWEITEVRFVVDSTRDDSKAGPVVVVGAQKHNDDAPVVVGHKGTARYMERKKVVGKADDHMVADGGVPEGDNWTVGSPQKVAHSDKMAVAGDKAVDQLVAAKKDTLTSVNNAKAEDSLRAVV